MWEPFTENARKTMAIALEEADRLGSGDITTEHILLGILGLPGCKGAKIIGYLGANPAEIRAEIDSLIPDGNAALNQHHDFSRGAKLCIENAFDESRLLENNYIGTEHLLLGIQALGEGIAAYVLQKRGIIPDKVRNTLKNFPEPSVRHVYKETLDRGTMADGEDQPDFGNMSMVIGEFDDREKPENIQISIYSANLKNALVIACEEAHCRESEFVDVEDLLEGIIRIPQCKAFRILTSRGFVTVERTAPLQQHTPLWEEARKQRIVFSKGATRVMKYAFNEFYNSSAKFLGTEYVLLGMLREGGGENLAGSILSNEERRMLNFEEVREHVKQMTMPPFTDEKKQRHGSTEMMANLGSRLARNEGTKGVIKPEPIEEESGAAESVCEYPLKIHSLENYCTNLTEKALSDDWEPVTGRQYEIDRIIQILSRYSRNNPLLISPSKTSVRAVVKGLAQRIVSGDVPDFLKNKRLLSLDIEEMLVSNPSRDLLEERMRRILNDLKLSGGILLFIPDIYHIFGPGGVNSAIYLPLVMKSMFSCGNIQCICSTGSHNYRNHIRHDTVLDRCFFPIEMKEANLNETMEILRSFRPVLEKHYHAMIDDETLLLSVRLAERYIKEGILPEKAIDLIEETASRMFGPLMKSQVINREMAKLEKLLDETKEKKAHVKAAMESFIGDNWDMDKSDYFAEKIKFFSGRMKQLEEEEKHYGIQLYEMKKDLVLQESKEKGIVRDISFSDIVETAGIKFDVLLCNYSGESKFLNEIAVKLEEKGIKTWTGECHIPPGRCRMDEMELVLPLVKTLAVAVGNETIPGDEKAETEELLRKFADKGKPVIPVILPETEGDPEIPEILRNIKPVDFRKETPDPWEELLWGILGKREKRVKGKE